MKNKTINLSSKASKDLGEEIKCINETEDENCITTEDDKGEFISVFSEDEPDLSGDVIKTFNFNDKDIDPASIMATAKMFHVTSDDSSKENDDSEIEAAAETDNISPDNKIKTYGATAPRDGEAFSIKRGYQFRPSTIRKLNEIKAKSDNINTYFNEIIDTAICYYYDAVVFKNKK